MSISNKTNALSKLTTPITGTGDDNLQPNIGEPIHAGNLQSYFTSFINWLFPSTIPSDLSGMSPIITDYGDTSLTPNTNYSNIKFMTIVPRGTINMYVKAGINTNTGGVYTSDIDGYLYCDGSVINLGIIGNEKYKKLRLLIGNNYGNTIGNPNILILPKFGGNIPMGYDANASTTPATSPLPTTNNYGNVGNTGGSNTVALNQNEIPSHNHTFAGVISPDGYHTHNNGVDRYPSGFPNGQYGGASYNGYFSLPWGSGINYWNNGNTSFNGQHTHQITGTIGNTGGGIGHENRQPYLVVNYIIKF